MDDGLVIRLGAVLGAVAGAVVGMAGLDAARDIAWAASVIVVLTLFLTLFALARVAGMSIIRATVAAIISIPTVALLALLGFAALAVALKLVVFAVPVTVMFLLIYLPNTPLSFMSEWPPEVVAAVTMPVVVLWLILLEHMIDRQAKKHPDPAPDHAKRRPPARIWTLARTAARQMKVVVTRAARPLRGWVVTSAQPFDIVFALLGGSFVVLIFTLGSWLMLGLEQEAVDHSGGLWAGLIGLLVGAMLGTVTGFVAYFAGSANE